MPYTDQFSGSGSASFGGHTRPCMYTEKSNPTNSTLTHMYQGRKSFRTATPLFRTPISRFNQSVRRMKRLQKARLGPSYSSTYGNSAAHYYA